MNAWKFGSALASLIERLHRPRGKLALGFHVRDRNRSEGRRRGHEKTTICRLTDRPAHRGPIKLQGVCSHGDGGALGRTRSAEQHRTTEKHAGALKSRIDRKQVKNNKKRNVAPLSSLKPSLDETFDGTAGQKELFCPDQPANNAFSSYTLSYRHSPPSPTSQPVCELLHSPLVDQSSGWAANDAYYAT